MDINKLTEKILDITNNSYYGWIHMDSSDADKIKFILANELLKYKYNNNMKKILQLMAEYIICEHDHKLAKLELEENIKVENFQAAQEMSNKCRRLQNKLNNLNELISIEKQNILE